MTLSTSKRTSSSTSKRREIRERRLKACSKKLKNASRRKTRRCSPSMDSVLSTYNCVIEKTGSPSWPFKDHSPSNHWQRRDSVYRKCSSSNTDWAKTRCKCLRTDSSWSWTKLSCKDAGIYSCASKRNRLKSRRWLYLRQPVVTSATAHWRALPIMKLRRRRSVRKGRSSQRPWRRLIAPSCR